MNIGDISSIRTPNVYDNSRRKEQANENRERIVDATIIVLKSEGEELTIPNVASRAGLSVPTVYRNFPTKESLLAATAAEISKRLGAPEWPDNAEDFAAIMPSIYHYFADNAPLFHARFSVDRMRAVLAEGQRARDEKFRRLFAPLVDRLSTKEAEAIVAFLRIITGVDVALAMTDRFGISPEVSGQVVAWVMTQLVKGLQADKIAGLSRITVPEWSQKKEES